MSVIDKTEVEVLRDKLTAARSEAYDLRAEISALQAQLDGNIPKATSWLQWKVWRQRVMLDILNKRVVAQRAVLRRLDVLGRGLTRDEWIALRDTVLPSIEEAFQYEGWVPPKE